LYLIEIAVNYDSILPIDHLSKSIQPMKVYFPIPPTTYKNFLFCVTVLLFHSFSFAQDLIQIGGGGSSHLNVIVTTSHNEGVEKGENLLSEVGLVPNLANASRFLAQTTLGANYELIDSVSRIGYSEWIEQQFAIPYTFDYEAHTKEFRDRAYETSDSLPMAGNYYYHYFTSSWTYDAINSPDLLRARVAFALSQIFVISHDNSALHHRAYTFSNYYDMLSANTFGNYRDLLEATALHPAMGAFLTHINNPKSAPEENRFPDENFAREIMQLFSIGLVQLNQDGTPILDAEGNMIPTYDNNDIAELAKVFTGLSWADVSTFGLPHTGVDSWIAPMQMFNEWHEPGEKTIIDDFVIPDRNPVDGMADIQDAIDHLFNHQNVAPFVCRQLIQRLVTANPTPAYVGRISAVFNDNGQGIRGDMKSIIRAILLDGEARDCGFINEDEAGKLREPVIRYTHLLRAFDFSTPSGEIRSNLNVLRIHMKQSPLGAPSVFNFYRPDFSPSGIIQNADKYAPEFQILDGNTMIGYANLLQTWMFHQYSLNHRFFLYPDENLNPDYDGTALLGTLDLSDELPLATDENLGELLERLNLILAHGRLSYTTKNHIIEALRGLPVNAQFNYASRRLQMAMFLVMISPEYLIFK